ncbi:AAA family ATPase [Klebsiella michiganensis]|uniref:AAA family ATPase n=1 Tax=Klebsiella michiganensis TaxID=1134687 RepID=UPI001CA4E364|nr:AAA family ATPase [Klebsiella michiganensis]MBW5995816.1 AAA family ATPase [Klebsiella michiganensis]
MPFVKKIIIKPELILTGEFPFTLPSVKAIDQLELHSAVTFFTGENGTGKSTVIESIAVAAGFNHEGGSKNFNFSTAENSPILSRAIRLSRSAERMRDGYFYRSESFYNVITQINKLDKEQGLTPPIKNSYGGRDLHSRSHGESFLDLTLFRFSGKGLYILDEPESALSVQNQLVLLSRINELVRKGSQFIIATHSPLLVAYPGASILEFSSRGIDPVNYEETENFALMKQYFRDPEYFMKQLF